MSPPIRINYLVKMSPLLSAQCSLHENDTLAYGCVKNRIVFAGANLHPVAEGDFLTQPYFEGSRAVPTPGSKTCIEY